MTWTPETNRVMWGLLTPEEQGAMLAAKHGWRRIDDYTPNGWVEDRHPTWSPDRVYRAIPGDMMITIDLQTFEEMADRIEALEAKLESLIAGAEAVLEEWDRGDEREFREAIEEMRADVAAAKGENDE